MRRLINFIKDLTTLIIWAVVRPILVHLPRSFSYRLAAWSGMLSARVSGGRRRTLEQELKKIFPDAPEKELARIAGRSFVFYHKRQVENLLFGSLTKEGLESMVSIQGIEHIEAARAKGKGAILCLSHFGSYLLVLPALAYRGYRVHQVFARPKTTEHITGTYNRVLSIRRDTALSLPVSFISAERDPRAVFHALQNNDLVAIALDGRVSNKWVPVSLFGGQSMVSPGPVRIAMISGAPVIPTFIVRNEDDTHTLILEKPIEMQHSRDEQDITADLQKLADRFDHYVRRYPCHFGMILQIMRERVRKGILEHSILP